MDDFDDDLEKILKMNPSNFKEPTSLKTILPLHQILKEWSNLNKHTIKSESECQNQKLKEMNFKKLQKF